ncbi:MAG: hypothetical protein ACD_11C00004G0021 [uncultured bacterium]|nr:MAG: hypothetical protein ACD_11C00004G0021 [uncultured bacterium]HBR71655.1 hypothetical protein [Candidatus Moranbacteria bacterium]
MLIIFFILGLIVGSFLNVVVYRLRLAETILGRSYCPHCKSKIRWYDNIPLLSFILLKAQCRDCRGKISWQYPAVEFLTGIVFALVGKYFFDLNNFQLWPEALFYLVVFSIFLVIFFYDLKFMEIPMIVLWVGVVWAAIFAVIVELGYLEPVSRFLSLGFADKAIGGAIAFLFFYALAHFSKETWMGYGDAYVGLLIGLVVGWEKLFMALTLSFAIGSVFSIGLVFFKKKTMKSQVPLAPFLVVGTILAIFIYEIFPSIYYLI